MTKDSGPLPVYIVGSASPSLYRALESPSIPVYFVGSSYLGAKAGARRRLVRAGARRQSVLSGSQARVRGGGVGAQSDLPCTVSGRLLGVH
jgi:hypothetical protein